LAEIRFSIEGFRGRIFVVGCDEDFWKGKEKKKSEEFSRMLMMTILLSQQHHTIIYYFWGHFEKIIRAEPFSFSRLERVGSHYYTYLKVGVSAFKILY
jgi:hypothetical protein